MNRKNLTEQELLQAIKMQTYFLDAREEDFSENLNRINHLLPIPVHMNELEGFRVCYFNPYAQEYYGKSNEELAAMDFDAFFDAYVLRETWEPMVPHLLRMVEERDERYVLTFFQAARPSPDQPYEWLFSTTKYLPSQNTLITIDTPVKQIDSLGKKMHRILDENRFVKTHFAQFAQLTKREREVLKLVCTGHANPAIAEKLFISRRTVEQHRKNINRKLETNKLAELIKYAQAFDLIT